MTDQSFPKSSRIKRSVDFTRMLRRGGCAADDCLVVFAEATTPGQTPRLGITIPKKTGNAVIRNRWKRHIREAFRTRRNQIQHGFDYIVRPKKDAVLNPKTILGGLPRLTVRASKRATPAEPNG